MKPNKFQIKNTFDWYLTNVLPVVEHRAIQNKYGYHGLYTHTNAVVFRGIDYALSIEKSPEIVALACALHDIARTNDTPDPEHGQRAIPLADRIISEVPYVLTRPERDSILYAVANHTTGMLAPDYISACMWDADRTRISWECGFDAKFFTTEYAKQVSKNSPEEYLQFMRQHLSHRALRIMGELNKQY